MFNMKVYNNAMELMLGLLECFVFYNLIL